MKKLYIKHIILLNLQKLLGNIFFPFIGCLIVFYFRYFQKYKIPEIKKIRDYYKSLIKQNKPILICPNHLTMIDSAIIQWALASNIFYLFHFSKFPWNIVAKENAEKNIIFRIITFLNKCILIDRKGTKEHKELILNKLRYVLSKKESVCIFIEGTRSPTGKLLENQINYGAGQLILDVPETNVIVIYLRGKHQKTKSDFPIKNEEFFLRYFTLQPETDKKGLRAQKEITLQILEQLKKFEDEYFSIYQ
ncbi:MAG: 1-acyl-sn-glycerol-3-phosphate acyltransferase [Leptospiraceae bacterium]|nr:MAG: 1-acyl-sn-glycerol-3-phosphate acyltransferase [Leptospiraceae bacterium]